VRLLYEEHAAPLWRYAARLTGDRARAEDVVRKRCCARGSTHR
jgi:RNA polymerase sigma-70 factor, ECF subfamily